MSSTGARDASTPSPKVLELPVALASVAFAFLNVALPLRADALGARGVEIGVLFAAFTALMVLVRPLVGWGLDRFGRRPFLLAALATYAVAMTLFGIADDLAGLLVARCVQGLAAALLWVAARTLIADRVARGERAEYMGRITERSVRGSFVGAVAGFALVGWLGWQLGWSLAFAGFALCALAGLVLIALRLPTEGGLGGDPRPPGGPRTPWPLLVVALLMATGVAAAFPFVLVALSELHGGDPIPVVLWMLPVAAVMAFVPSRAGRLADRGGAVKLAPPGLVLAGAAAAAVGILRLLPPFPSLLLDAAAIAGAFVLLIAGNAVAEPGIAAAAGGRDAGTYGRRYGRYALATGAGAVVGPVAGGVGHDVVGTSAPFWLAAAALLGSAVFARYGTMVVRAPAQVRG